MELLFGRSSEGDGAGRHRPAPSIIQGQGTQIPPEKLLEQQTPGAQQTPLQQVC